MEKIADNVMLKEFAVDLVLLGEDLSSFRRDLKPYLDNCATWLRLHAPKPTGFSKPLDKQLSRMESVVGIEEFFSDKELGLKGKVDVSFKVSAVDICA